MYSCFLFIKHINPYINGDIFIKEASYFDK